MIKNIDTLNNPFVKVTWEDTAENFTKERKNRIKTYFQNKYKTKNVNIITKITDSEKLEREIDLSESVTDKVYQKKLIKDFITKNNIEVDIVRINALDDKINSELEKTTEATSRNRKWYIKKIEFSNFLSYGDNNVIDFDKYDGITIIESNPSNFAGKTSAIELLLFLFFNTTTKTNKAGEIFNRFRDDKNTVEVRGEIVIDGVDYVIERIIERKKSKSGDWTVKTDLNFSKINENGEVENLAGEQRRETESFIKTVIGTQDEFLLTIIATSNNLENLIDSKPTERGEIFTKFIGLESLKEKELLAKEMYSEWSKKLISNIYNKEELKASSESLSKDIDDAKIEQLSLDTKVVETKESISKGEIYKDDLLSKRHNDIDQNLTKINPALLDKEITEQQQALESEQNKYDSFIVTEPSEYFKEPNLVAEQKILDDLKLNFQIKKNKLSETVSFIKALKEGEYCPKCKRKLDGVDHENEIKENEAAIPLYEADIVKFLTDIAEQDIAVKKQLTLKDQFIQYDKNKLIKERFKISVENYKNILDKKIESKDKWEQNKNKLEENRKTDDLLIKTKSRLDALNFELQSFINKINSLTEKINRNTITIQDNQNKITQIEKEEKDVKIFTTYLTIYGKNGITKWILKNTIPALNNELSKLLSDSAKFTLELRINDKNELEFWMIDNDTSIEKLMITGSGYERTIAALALRTVLSKICSLPKPNIIVFDEVLGKVSNENLDLINQFFMKIKDYFDKIFIITHNPLVKEFADNVITITKTDNISSLN